MVPILLITAALSQAAGAPPTAWKPLTGVTGIHYRWSRPTSNSCIVEFESEGGAKELQFRVTANVVSTNPPAAIEYNPDSPMQIESTKIKPQMADRVFSMQLPRQGENSEYLHGCYGIGRIAASTGTGHPSTTSQSLPKRESSGIH